MMTENEWLSSEDPAAMRRLVSDGSPARRRQLRLFDAACCRRVWHRLTDPRSRRAVEVAELYADGLATAEPLAKASRDAWQAHLSRCDAAYYAALAAYYAVNDPESPDSEDVADAVTRSSYLDPDDPEQEDVMQAALCRDIFGNPFRASGSLEPADLTADAISLARRIYAERDFAIMPVLARLLEVAGCRRADILEHLRASVDHARGCWALDAILGE